MHENTPPRVPDISDSECEEVILDNYLEEPDELDENDFEEVTMEDLERRLQDSSWEEIPDLSRVSYNHHFNPVFACSLHPNGEYAATGGEDDEAHVWNIKSGEVIETINHRDSIIEVHFNHDGSYLLTADISGELKVFKCCDENGDGVISFRKVFTYSIGDLAWAEWHRAANVILAGSDSGEIYMFRIPSGDCKLLPGHGYRCENGKLTFDGKNLFTSYANGNLKLWDLKNTSVVFEVNEQHPLAHNNVVNAVACHKDSPLYMSGGADGKILFLSNNGPVGSVEADGHVECVAFSPSSQLQLAASGTLSGQIAIWDYGKFTLRTICNHKDDGITNLKWISDYTLMATTIGGNMYGFDARSGIQKFNLTGHRAEIYHIAYLPQHNILLSVSEDQYSKIFEIDHTMISD